MSLSFHKQNIKDIVIKKEWSFFMPYIFHWFIRLPLKRTYKWSLKRFDFLIKHWAISLIQIFITPIMFISDTNHLYWLLEYDSLSPLINNTKPYIKPLLNNSLIFNLCIGYTVSLVFYILVVYIPERANANKIKPMRKRLLTESMSVLGDILEVISNEFQIQNNNPKYKNIGSFNQDELRVALEYVEKTRVISASTNASHNRHIIYLSPSLLDYIRISLENLNTKIRGSVMVNKNRTPNLVFLSHIRSVTNTH